MTAARRLRRAPQKRRLPRPLTIGGAKPAPTPGQATQRQVEGQLKVCALPLDECRGRRGACAIVVRTNPFIERGLIQPVRQRLQSQHLIHRGTTAHDSPAIAVDQDLGNQRTHVVG